MDIIERLRNAPNWMREGFGKSWKDTALTFDRAPFEGADEIVRIDAENTTLRAQVAALQADAARLDWLLDNAITILMLSAQTLQTQDRAGIDAARRA